MLALPAFVLNSSLCGRTKQAVMAETAEITQVLQAIGRSEEGAAEKLLPLVYAELRRLAGARMAHEMSGQTLQPTALVHEAWLRLVKDGDRTWQNRAHFFGAAAEAMRRILIERARHKSRLKHGGGQARLNIEDLELAQTTPDDKILLVDEALARLKVEDPELERIVVLRFFGGLSNEEIAETLRLAPRSLDRQWAYARAWLFRYSQRAEVNTKNSASFWRKWSAFVALEINGQMSTRNPREKAVFVEALAISDPEQRRQFLDQACGADKALREQVEKLLGLSQGAGDFFKECAPALEPVSRRCGPGSFRGEAALEPELPKAKRIGALQITPEAWGRGLRGRLYGGAGRADSPPRGLKDYQVGDGYPKRHRPVRSRASGPGPDGSS
jgi:RNA polymerase sigma factor (TIGR02999 family)